MTIAKWTATWPGFSGLDREQALAGINRNGPRWIVLLLVLAIAWQVAALAWMLVPASPVGDPVAAPPAGAARATTAGQPDVQFVAATHIFGQARSEAPPPPPTDHEDVAETRLNLSLKGTLTADVADQSIAIIADTGNDEKVYAIRDTVVPGTTLHAVYADRVILNRGGALEALTLPRDFPRGAAPVRRAAPAVTRTVEDSAPSLQQVVSENVTKLADVIRPTPYFVAGQQQGYRVYPGRDRRQFAALGLRPGDLIKDIDGAALTDPQQAMEIFQNLGSADQVSVTVERNGQPEVLVLTTSQLSLDNDQ